MSDHRRRWATEDYPELSWHDNHVHGLRISTGRFDLGLLELDLDFILEWLQPSPDRFAWKVAPALLTFHEVMSLKIDIDYATVGAAVCPFSLEGIYRAPLAGVPEGASAEWTIRINWPEGVISFTASGLTQVLRGPVVLSEEQHLLRAAWE